MLFRSLTELNESLCAILKQTVTPLFATAFYLVADVARGEMSYASAGHPPQMHVRRRMGSVELLAPDHQSSLALGVLAETAYPAAVRPLAADDLVMLYTDGLFEVEHADGTLFDRHQLLAAVAQRVMQPTRQLFDDLLETIKSFSATNAFEDDMCLVGMDVARLLRVGG